jgi:hypothetical protein
MAKILTISHYIYLSKEERYQLFNQIPLETVGISIPVWFDKGTTSEPAKEIFCRYCITNNKTSKSISSNLEGYNINLPQNFKNYKLYESSAIRLLDAKDGGCEELAFKQNAKLNKDNKNYSVIHFIEIKPIEVLLETIV